MSNGIQCLLLSEYS